jgi:hypothetical protein
MTRNVWIICAVAAAVSGALAAGVDPQRYIKDVKYLASPELKGRGNGTPGGEKAARFVAKSFRKAGIKPLQGQDGYFQKFPVTTNAKIGPNNAFTWTGPGGSGELKASEQFIPFNLSSSGHEAGAVVFAGYGITAKEYNYDDYTQIDAKDKIVVILRHEPQEFLESSVFAGKALTRHAQFDSKASNAKMHGARAVILVSDVAAHPSDSEQLEKFGRAAGPMNAGLPFVQAKSDAVAAWFAMAGKDLKEISKAIDGDLKPRSFAFPDSLKADVTVDVTRETRTVENVVGYKPGETDEYVILGAHYDHLGLGEQFSMAPSQAGTPHLGADDNASGASGLIELARYFGKQPKQKRGILFVAFAAEELGLLGSSYYVNHPDLPTGKAVAMINMDMIGRLRDNKILIGGAGTGAGFKAALEPLIKQYNFKADLSEQMGYGSSDHTSFTTKQIPVLFFFTGLHEDYHRPSDTWDKITGPETARLLDMIGTLTTQLASGPERPKFVYVAPPATMASGASGGGSGYGAWFGSIPDFGDNPNGVKFADVSPGSPAAKAGLKGGDVMTEFDGKKMQNLYDFTYALRQHKPGDEVVVKVLRNGQVMETRVLLGQRK